jgi:hypothetical protein
LALLAGTDFFTAEVLTLRGLVTYYVLFFIHLESRRVDIAGITIHPDEPWMRQIARNVTMEGCGTLRDCRLYEGRGVNRFLKPGLANRTLRGVATSPARRIVPFLA